MLAENFARHEAALIEALEHLIRYDYPQEVHALSFEVFPDSFAGSFPARVFFMDASNNEFFVYIDGKAQYPSPIDPEILNIDGIYTGEEEDDIIEQCPSIEDKLWDIASREFIKWFSACWDKAGGQEFSRAATIACHDSDEELNLITKQKQPVCSSFKF